MVVIITVHKTIPVARLSHGAVVDWYFKTNPDPDLSSGLLSTSLFTNPVKDFADHA